MSENLCTWPDLDQIPFEPIFVARQPVFDRDQNIWGYELLFRHSGMAASAEITDAGSATAQVIVDGVCIALSSLNERSRILINFPEDLLLQGTPYALPRESCVIEILETVSPSAEVVAVCQKLKTAGYTLALDDYTGDASFEPLIQLADIIKVDVFGMTSPELIRVTKSLAGSNAVLLAEKVEDERTWQMTRALGYSLFQGYYFSRPEVFPGRKVSLGAIARLRLLHELLQEEYEVKKLSKIITTDASLSYRLLRFINSLAFSLSVKVSSISQAVAYLGGTPLRQWLMAVAIADVSPSPRSEEIAFGCVLRAKFLELLALQYAHAGLPHDHMFLLGLFSKLDLLLGLSMQELLEQMPLENMLKNALLHKQGKVYIWLELAYAIETGSWDTIEALSDDLHLSKTKTAQIHVAAVNWANAIMRIPQV